MVDAVGEKEGDDLVDFLFDGFYIMNCPYQARGLHRHWSCCCLILFEEMKFMDESVFCDQKQSSLIVDDSFLPEL
jgi:hypothetical protein